MGKYESYHTRAKPLPKREIHAIWRGIGFVMAILIPFMSYIGALILLEENAKKGWYGIPGDLIAPSKFFLFGQRIYLEPLLYVKIMLTVALLFIFYSLFLFITALMNRLLAPPRYTVYDAPPQAFRGKKKGR
jgi:hypothetical protein